MMDLKTTRYYLDCYGADVTRWPEPEAGKIALAVYAQELGDELTAAQQLDVALSTPTPAPSDLLSRRIMANLPAQDGAPANDVSPPRRLSWRAIAATFVVLGAVGFSALNLRAPAPAETPSETEVWREAALTMGVDDVYDWVYAEEG